MNRKAASLILAIVCILLALSLAVVMVRADSPAQQDENRAQSSLLACVRITFRTRLETMDCFGPYCIAVVQGFGHQHGWGVLRGFNLAAYRGRTVNISGLLCGDRLTALRIER